MDAEQRLEQAKRRLDVAHADLKGGDGHRAAEAAVKAYWDALRAIAPAQNDGLTPRQREVLKLIASGKSSREVATSLGITFKTAVAHRYNLHRKLKVHKSVDLMRVAIRMGFVKA